MGYTYEHPRMAVSVDIVLFAAGDPPEVLLIQRGKEPFAGKWALPGGFVDMDERAADAASRELAEETGVGGVNLTFLDYFDAIDRDPRGRTLSLTFWGVAPQADMPTRAEDDAADVRWFPVTSLPPLAFDHDDIVAEAFSALDRMETKPNPSAGG
ncbi:MAG: NUDIX domain-containing protein [Dichotomicrobium sp.]